MLIKSDPIKPSEEIIDLATAILERGGIIIYPTETAYGIGCDGFNEKAIANIYRIKDRDKNQPLSVIVHNLELIEKIAYLNKKARKLIEEFYPGPLVIALPKKAIIPDILNPTGIAFRISSHPIAQEISAKLQKPIVSTSANKSGEPAPYSILEVVNSLERDHLDLIIDTGTLPYNKPSTIVDFQMKPAPQIIREGEISAKRILSTLGIPMKEWKKHLQSYR
ncbi:MAG: threonylcarbamoyl-AMP synthase [Candidatus Heimdallarchaeota archaeon]|nr:threonylcarbamoyl-AMP synthase [Candidatus Heimdallarchaeota archaeon]